MDVWTLLVETMDKFIKLGMILSCAAGITAIDIDDDFSDTVTAILIKRKLKKRINETWIK